MLPILMKLSFPATLAVCAGMRAFLPLLALTIMVQAGHLEVAPYFALFFSRFMLPIYFLLAVGEIVVDKFRILDDFIDNIFLILRPAASFLAVASLVSVTDNIAENLMIAFVISLLFTTSVHVTKARSRVLSAAKHYLSFNLNSSLVEDGLCIAGIVLALLVPVISFPIVFVGTFYTFKIMRRSKLAMLDHFREIQKAKRVGPKVTKVKKLKKIR